MTTLLELRSSTSLIAWVAIFQRAGHVVSFPKVFQHSLISLHQTWIFIVMSNPWYICSRTLKLAHPGSGGKVNVEKTIFYGYTSYLLGFFGNKTIGNDVIVLEKVGSHIVAPTLHVIRWAHACNYVNAHACNLFMNCLCNYVIYSWLVCVTEW